MSTASAKIIQTRKVHYRGISRAEIIRARKLIPVWNDTPRDREFCVEVGVLPTDSEHWYSRGKQAQADVAAGKSLTTQSKLYLEWATILDQAQAPLGDGYPADGLRRSPIEIPPRPGNQNVPIRLNDDVIDQLCRDIRDMIPYSVSLECLGFSKGVMAIWLANADRADARVEVGLPPEVSDHIYLKLRTELAKARRDVIRNRMEVLREITDGERRGEFAPATWQLERLFPKEFRGIAPVEDEESAGKRGGGSLTLVLNQAAATEGGRRLQEPEIIDGHRRLPPPSADFHQE